MSPLTHPGVRRRPLLRRVSRLPRLPRLLLARSVLALLLAAPLALLTASGAVADDRQGIASAHPLATEAGLRILAEGGNAFDAAVAVAAALAVVEPYSSGIGGGGFFLLHRARDRRDVMVDARETAPASASARMFVDAQGRALARASLDGPLSAAIPGVPAGLAHLSSQYGQLPLARALAPAIALARDGFAVDERFATIARLAESRLARDAGAARVFLPNGRAPVVGERLQQPALAGTLARLAADGHAGFYEGPVATDLVAAVRAGGGIWQAKDLAAYRVIERAPMHIEYRGARIVTAALPSSGGVVLAQSLNILGLYPALEARTPGGAHLVSESLRRAFEDRARWLGDPDFGRIPVSDLVSMNHARARATDLDPARASVSRPPERDADRRESGNTTHFSIVDAAGNKVAATLTVNTLFGSGFVAGSTGVLLNNEMDDFALPGGQPNAYGLAGGVPNLIEPGKRPLSSMTPTFVETSRGWYVIGTPGGSRIISMLLLALLDITSAQPPSPAEIVSRPRFHHQFLPDRIDIEPAGFNSDWVEALRTRGHAVQPATRAWGNMQLVFIDRANGRVTAVNDPRGRAGIAWF